MGGSSFQSRHCTLSDSQHKFEPTTYSAGNGVHSAWENTTIYKHIIYVRVYERFYPSSPGRPSQIFDPVRCNRITQYRIDYGIVLLKRRVVFTRTWLLNFAVIVCIRFVKSTNQINYGHVCTV